MAIRPTFFGFEMARSALSANQRHIDATGQNIANINTLGYSRQRVNVSAIGAGGMDWKFAISPSQNVGLGVNIDSIRRVRDEFLDIRFRTENSHNERFAVKNDVLNSVEGLLDEFMNENIYAILNDFNNALQNLHMQSDEVEFASLMRSAALKLTSTLNKVALDLNHVIEMQLMQMELVATTVNNIARQLDDVNREIRMQHLINPLIVSNELLDRRDLLIDQLSGFGEVTVITDDSYGLWIYFGEMHVSQLTIERDPVTGMVIDREDFYHPNLLVVGDRSGHRTLEFDRTEWFNDLLLRYELEPLDNPVRLTWNEDGVIRGFDSFGQPIRDPNPAGGDGEPFFTRSGQIFGYYEMMNGIGDVEAFGDEFDRATKGIPYFMAILNRFTQVFAETFNMLNSEDPEGGPLFSMVGDNETELNIFNITISEEWQQNAMFIVRSTLALDIDTPGDSRNDHLLRMIDALRREDIEFDMSEVGGTGIFVGSFQQAIVMMKSELAIEIDYNNSRLAMSDTLLLSIDSMRSSIKGVSEDEEAMNLVRFQRSYQAAVRLMTTLDEMLELIIMRMGIVGR